MLRFALAAAGLAAVQASVSVTISNSCSESVALYDNSATTTLASGSSTTRTLANGYVGMFRNGVSDEATLAEISVDSDGTPWYDISIIPPDPGSCTSLSACQSQTGKTGFNTAMQITPQDNIGDDTCEVLTCEADGCSDAYQYPSDDTKTHTCPEGTSFEVTFCPGGSGTSTSSTTSSSTTSTPTPTTATPTPTTATPTPTPTSTPVPTEAPVSRSASSSASASTSGSTGIQVQTENYAGNFTFSSSSNSASADSAGNAGVETVSTKSTTTTTTTTDSTAVQTTGTTTTTSASGSDGAVEVTTKSSDNNTSSLTYIFVLGGCVAGIASGGFIYAVQQKKKALDMEAKSPMDIGDRSCRDVSVLVSTPDSLSARL